MQTGLSRQQFVLLPKTNKHCSKVGTVQGLWYFCSTCNKQVACRNGRPFTLARWNDHQESPEHQDHVRRSREVACLELKMKASDGKLTSLEQQTLGQLSKKQPPMQKFFRATVSKKEECRITKSSSSLSGAAEPVIDTDGEVEVVPASSQNRVSCEEVFPDFRGSLKDPLRAYSLYASIGVKSHYKVGYVSGVGREKAPQIFSKACNGGKVVYRKHVHGRIFSCDKCEGLRFVSDLSYVFVYHANSLI